MNSAKDHGLEARATKQVSILDDTPLFTALFVATRAVHFGACLLLFGVPGFDRLIIASVIRSYPQIEAGWKRTARILLVISCPLALISGAIWLALNAINMSGLPPGEALRPDVLRVVLTDTHFGKLWEFRSSMWLWTTLILFASSLMSIAPRPFSYIRYRNWQAWLALIASGVFTGSLAWAGHGLTGELATMHLYADAIHILICGFWPIGLLPLAMLLIQLYRLPDSAKWPAMAMLVRRFSAMSLFSVAVLVLTGIINTWALVGSVSNLFSSTYGLILLAKIVLFCGMLALGAMNLIHLKPRLSIDLADGISTQGEIAARRLQKNVAIEVALAAGIFVLVGLLGMLPPAAHEMMHHHH